MLSLALLISSNFNAFSGKCLQFLSFLVYLTTPNRPDRFWAPLSLLFNRYRDSFPLVKRAELEAYHLSPSIARVKNEWTYTSTVPPYTFMAYLRTKKNTFHRLHGFSVKVCYFVHALPYPEPDESSYILLHPFI